MKLRHLGYLCIVLSWFSCNPPKDSAELSGKKVFRYNESAGISFLDPAMASRFEDMWAMAQLFNGLVELDRNLKCNLPLPNVGKSAKTNWSTRFT
jgi:peptide/nickel transport system substrate-binding protein